MSQRWRERNNQNAALVSPISDAPSNEAFYGAKAQGSSSTGTSQNSQFCIALEAFYASHVNSPLINDDLEQVNQDDLEEMDIK